jgi:DNA-binding response OmpR family regulator
LALVKESVQALGGSIDLESAPDQGARFTIHLPTCPPPMAGPAEPDTSLVSERVLLESAVVSSELRQPDDAVLAADLADAAPADDRPRILVVEDNADLRALLVATLAPTYRCTTAADGRTGVERALEDPPELVISDVLMPGMDGFELTETLKRDERSSHVPIVLLTALGDRESRLHGLSERADDYLVKPFDADELLLRVRNLVESREIARQHAARRLYDGERPIPDTTPADLAAHGPREQAFLERLRAAALRGHADTGFGVSELARHVAMSERQLQRKVRALLAVSPADYLRELRLQQAADRLRRGEPPGNVAFDVGFASRSHFGACFKARFGMTPGEFTARPPAR